MSKEIEVSEKMDEEQLENKIAFQIGFLLYSKKKAGDVIRDLKNIALKYSEQFKSDFSINCSDIEEKDTELVWIKISTSLPPYGQNVIFRAVIKYRTENSVVIFNDQITTDQEGLDYGLTAHLLKDKTDFIVCDHKDVEDLYDEVVTHWMPIPEAGI
jgi:hypothetical protein